MALNNSNLNSPNNNSAGGQAATATNNNNNAAATVDAAVVAANENLVVRVDDNSQDNLQALFDTVLKPNESRRPLQVPFRMRKLPSSFFNPPSTGSKSPSVSHSRENSADSAFGSGSTTLCSSTAAAHNPVTNRFQITHSRAHSSPASLQQTYAGLNVQSNNPAVVAAVVAANAAAAAANNAANGSNATGAVPNAAPTTTAATVAQQQPVHIKQRSYDVVSAIQLREELGELPPGWEQARTAEGQIYYLK